jgi:UDP-2,3-diacylglucosamine hydrolase
LKKIYFASDFHLGIPDSATSREREKKVCLWLDMVKNDGAVLYLVGDLFDFWFDYQTVVPRGYIRVLGKLAELKDAGVEIHFFVGNHDLWMRDYFTVELGIPIYREAIQVEHYGKKFFIAHGDGLGPGDTGYKLMKKVFVHPFSMWLYRWLHPDIGVRLAKYFSTKSRLAQSSIEGFLGEENEWLFQYSQRKSEQLPEIDFFVFGHRHLQLDLLLKNNRSRYINLGEWFKECNYAVWNGEAVRVLSFEDSCPTDIRSGGEF